MATFEISTDDPIEKWQALYREIERCAASPDYRDQLERERLASSILSAGPGDALEMAFAWAGVWMAAGPPPRVR